MVKKKREHPFKFKSRGSYMGAQPKKVLARSLRDLGRAEYHYSSFREMEKDESFPLTRPLTPGGSRVGSRGATGRKIPTIFAMNSCLVLLPYSARSWPGSRLCLLRSPYTFLVLSSRRRIGRGRGAQGITLRHSRALQGRNATVKYYLGRWSGYPT